jgi:hydrogenase nickel incorporation protein HypA/HybF
MHEYSIVEALIERVDEEARARRAVSVDRLSVRIGELAGIDPDLLSTAYSNLRAGTVCANASLEVHGVAACWECPSCGLPFARGAVLTCDACGVAARLNSGDEIVLERIEMEVS